ECPSSTTTSTNPTTTSTTSISSTSTTSTTSSSSTITIPTTTSTTPTTITESTSTTSTNTTAVPSTTSTLPCPPGETVCECVAGEPFCADTNTDVNNCGSCCNICPEGNTCASGICVLPSVGGACLPASSVGVLIQGSDVNA